MNKLMAVGTLALVAIAACSQDNNGTGPAADRAMQIEASAAAMPTDAPGAVYALVNQASGNAVAVFNRAADGSLAWRGTVATGGSGAGSGNSRYLYQLNGDRSISGFRIEADGHLTPAGRTAGMPASTVGLVAR
jgi:hypothetical protein